MQFQPKLLRRFVPALLMLMMFVSVSTLGHAVQVTSTWTGAGDGTSYTDPANWSTPEYPRNGTPAGTTYRAVIDGNGARVANVQLNRTSVTVDALVVDAGDNLALNNALLEVVNSGAGTGTIANGGTISLNFEGTFFGGVTTLRINGDITLSGGGTINLGDQYVDGSTPLNVISGAAATDRLINADNIIRGAGGIGAGQMLLTNRGTVVANGTNPMLVQLSAGSNINTGTLRGDGGTLVLLGSSFNNAGGFIEARNASRAELISTTIIGGTLNTMGSGVVTTTGFRTMTGAILNNVTNTGNIVLSGSSSLSLFNTLTNSGTIALNGFGDGKASIIVNESVTLNGGGSITLSDTLTNGSEFANNINGEGTLTNVDNTISGAAIVSGPTIINQGTIVPVGQNALTLLNPITNMGTIRVDAGNKMTLSFARTLTQAAGLLLVNGTFNSSSLNGSGTIAVTGGTLAGTGTIAANVTNSGGTVSPGNFTASDVSSVGALTVDGIYGQTANGKLLIQINGPTAGSDFDQLLTTGAANFAGALNVKLGASYAPARDTAFSIVTFGSSSGQMTLNVVDRDERGGFAQNYNPTDLTLVAEGTPFFGVSLRPTNPNTNATLTATVVASAAPSGVTYDFRVNGVSAQNGASNTYDLSVAGRGDKNDVISVVARTDDNRSASNQVTVANTLPVVDDATANAGAGQTIDIPIIASDLDGDTLTFGRVGPSNGTAEFVTVNGQPALRYRSRADFGGIETITVIANDGQQTSNPSATFTINVNLTPPPPPNRAPIANSTSASVEADQSIDIPVSGNDPDGDPITFEVQTGARNGTGQFVLVNGQIVFRYRSRAFFNGSEAISFVTRDNKDRSSEPATIAIDVNYTPPPVNQRPVGFDTTVSADSGVQVELPVSVTDDAPLIQLFLRNVTGPRNGTGFFRYTAQGFVFVYTARAGFSGVDTVPFVATDNGGLESRLATLTINVRDATPVANSTSASANSEQSIDIPVTGTSPVGAPLTFRVVTGARNGTGQFVLVNGRSVFRYRSRARFGGTESIQFIAVDSRGRQSRLATLTIRVTDITPIPNRPPLANDASANVRRGQLAVTVDIPLSGSDPDGDPITFRIVNRPRAGTGEIINTGPGRAIFRYRSNGAFNASDTATFVTVDPSGRTSNVATIRINATASVSSAIQTAPTTDSQGGSGGKS